MTDERGRVTGVERREHARLPVRGSAEVRTRQGKLIAEAVDISASGVCLTLSRPLDSGGVYDLDLLIPGECEHRSAVTGRVCFCIKEKDGYRIGFSCASSPLLS